MVPVRHLAPTEPVTLLPWPELPGAARWVNEQLLLSPEVPTDVLQQLTVLLELLCARESDIQAQGEELLSAVPGAIAELAQAAAAAVKVDAANREERTFLPRFWRISRRNLERLRRLGISFGADDIHFIETDRFIRCEVLYLGI